MHKLTSRKFWVAVAAFLASLGASIAGFATDEPVVIWIGVICTTLSAAIYAASEAYVDGKAASATITTVSTTSTTSTAVNATTTSATTADKILNAGKVVEKVDETLKIGGTD